MTAIRAFWLGGENSRRLQWLRAGCQGEDSIIVIRGLIRLDSQHRKVLSDVVAENGSEHAKVVSTAIACTNDGLRSQLVRDAKPRCEQFPAGLHSQVRPNALTRHDDLPSCRIEEAAFSRPVHFLG